MSLRTGVGCNGLNSWNERNIASDEAVDMKCVPSAPVCTLLAALAGLVCGLGSWRSRSYRIFRVKTASSPHLIYIVSYIISSIC